MGFLFIKMRVITGLITSKVIRESNNKIIMNLTSEMKMVRSRSITNATGQVERNRRIAAARNISIWVTLHLATEINNLLM